MKEGWERKKIKEVADVVGGSTPKTNVEEYWGGNNYWVTPAELDGSKYIEKTVRCITSNAVDKTNLTLMPSGTVLLSSRAPIGKVCITKAPMYCNQGFKNLICKELLYNEFAYYFLKHNVDYLQSLGTGATFKEISKKVVENVTIPVPPLSEQQHIVEELDLLSSIIEKKKAQLIELDNLAQSLFYEMFGDPITNDKGWETKTLGDISNYSKTRITAKELTVKNYVGVENLLQKCEGKVDAAKVPDGIGLTEYLKDDVLIGNIRPYLRKIWLATYQGGCNGDVLVIRRLPLYLNAVNPIYLFKCLSDDAFFDFDMQYSKGEKMPRGDKKEILKYPICIPPIDLQNQFASKIEAVEHQKELIKQSIKEVETLFNSRMDYYFN